MNITNHTGLHPSIVKAVSNDEYVRVGDASATQLTGPPRIYWLNRRHDKEMEVDAAQRIYALLGRAIHHVLQASADENCMVEERLVTDVQGWKISGQADLFTETAIQDWKFTSVWTKIYNADKAEYVWQLNIYKYLAAKNGFDKIDLLQNVFIYRDWSRMKAQTNRDYPQQQVEVVTQRSLLLDEIDHYINERVILFKSHENTPDHLLPACSDEERWHEDDKYALMKKGRKSAVKLCSTEQEANDLLMQGYKGGDSIVKRTGVDKRCALYCECNNFCSHYQDNVKPIGGTDGRV